MRKFISRSLWFALILGLNAAWAQEQSEDAKLESFFKGYLDKSFGLQPLQGTELGDHRFDAQLEDLSPAGRAHWLQLTRATLGSLPKQIDYRKLSRGSQIDFEILEHALKADEWLTENFHPFVEDTRIYNGYIN